jgi:gas vesicle protein
MRIRSVQNDLSNTKEEVAKNAAQIEVTSIQKTLEVEQRQEGEGTLNSRITQTASQIRLEVNNAVSGLQSSITQTASQIRLEVSNAVSGLNSSITQTASQIRTEVSNAESRLSSSITQTASQIRSEVTNAVSGLSSSITQTASQIRSEVKNSISGLNSSITQTASQIRSEVSNAVSGLNSSITQTASQIRSEVTNAVSGLSSRITQEANRISLVVEGTGADAKIKTASIVAGINDQSGSYVQISADKINLTGYVTASQLSATQADIDNLISGSTLAASIKANQLQASSSFSMNGHRHNNSTITIGGVNFNIVTWT